MSFNFGATRSVPTTPTYNSFGYLTPDFPFTDSASSGAFGASRDPSLSFTFKSVASSAMTPPATPMFEDPTYYDATSPSLDGNRKRPASDNDESQGYTLQRDPQFPTARAKRSRFVNRDPATEEVAEIARKTVFSFQKPAPRPIRSDSIYLLTGISEEEILMEEDLNLKDAPSKDAPSFVSIGAIRPSSSILAPENTMAVFDAYLKNVEGQKMQEADSEDFSELFSALDLAGPK